MDRDQTGAERDQDDFVQTWDDDEEDEEERPDQPEELDFDLTRMELERRGHVVEEETSGETD